MNPQKRPETLTLTEAAASLRISRTTLWRLVSPESGAPKIQVVRIGRRVLVPRVSLSNFIRQEMAGPEVRA